MVEDFDSLASCIAYLVVLCWFIWPERNIYAFFRMESQLLQLLILDGFSKKIVASSPLQVEALAFMEACLVMTRKELKNVCITGDNQSLVPLSSSENASPRESVYYS